MPVIHLVLYSFQLMTLNNGGRAKIRISDFLIALLVNDRVSCQHGDHRSHIGNVFDFKGTFFTNVFISHSDMQQLANCSPGDEAAFRICFCRFLIIWL